MGLAIVNCFEWQNQVSDFLDGALTGDAQKSAEAHLESCELCSERHKRYRLLVTSIAGQPRSALPPAIRKSPFSAGLPALDWLQPGRTRWEYVPWYIRTTVEGTGIIAVILLAVSAGPKLRSLYEKSIERSLNDFSDTMNSPEVFDSAPLVRGGLPANPAPADAADSYAAGETGEDASDAGDSSDSEEEVPVNVAEIKVGNSEIWRFNLKSDSPREIRPQIVKILADSGLGASAAGIGGIEAPGGIQFDLLVPKSAVAGVKKQIELLAPAAPAGAGDNSMSQTFTWYKNKSKQPIPAGKTRIVIWLSQI
jgi:hypothetical protein